MSSINQNHSDNEIMKPLQSISLEEQLALISEYNAKSVDVVYDKVQSILCTSVFTKDELSVLAFINEKKGILCYSDEVASDLNLSMMELDHIFSELKRKGILKDMGSNGNDSVEELDIDFDKLSLPWQNEVEKSGPESIDALIQAFDSHSDKYENDSISSGEYVCKMTHNLKETAPIVYTRYVELAKNLDTDTKAALLFLSGIFLTRGIEPYDPSSSYNSQNRFLAKGIDGLILAGLAEVVQEETGVDNKSNCKDRCRLSAMAVRELFYGMEELVNFRALCHRGEIIKCNDIKAKQLYFEKEVRKDIDTIRKIVDKDRFADIVARLEKKGRRAGINILLYGGPGVGKTELARQLARETGRNLYMASASKLNGNLIGDSEKNVSELFSNFRYLNAVSANTPILLLNEADGILGKRGPVYSSASRSDNVVQTIFLQELERFNGILTATTNLEGNLDPAFERRFLFKLKVSLPSPEVRAAIWREHIPGLSKKNAIYLAQQYTLSGGQIENVAIKCDIQEAVNCKAPRLNQIREFCEVEKVESMKDCSKGKTLKGYASYSSK